MDARLRESGLTDSGTSAAMDAEAARAAVARFVAALSPSPVHGLHTREDDRYRPGGGPWGAVLELDGVAFEAYGPTEAMAVSCALLLSATP